MDAGRFCRIHEARKQSLEEKVKREKKTVSVETVELCATDDCKNGRIPYRDTCYKCGKCGRKLK